MASLVQTQMEANALLREHGLADKGWRFVYDNARKRGGYCQHHIKTISMSRYLVPLWTEEQVTETLLHEAAHALVGPGAGHGPVWKRKAWEIGCREGRTHSNATVEGRYVSSCTKCGKQTGTRHRRPQNMSTGWYTHRGCGGDIAWLDTARQTA